jgi:membrane-bound ClpP family serine protease
MELQFILATARAPIVCIPEVWLLITLTILSLDYISKFNLKWAASAALIMLILLNVTTFYSITIPIGLNIGIFLSCSLIFWYALKRKHTQTNVKSFIGNEAIAIQNIPKSGIGMVKIQGQTKPATHINQEEIPMGAIYTILKTQGDTLIIKPTNKIPWYGIILTLTTWAVVIRVSYDIITGRW